MQQNFLRRKLRQFHFILKRIKAHRTGKNPLNNELLQQLHHKATSLFKKIKSQLSFTDLRKVAVVFGTAFLLSQSPLRAQEISFAPPETNPFGLEVLSEDGENFSFSFVDIDNDGDLDVFGSRGEYIPDNGTIIKYVLCENVGTPQEPQFIAPVDFTQENGMYGARFADMDDDGDLDALSIFSSYNYDENNPLFAPQYAENIGTASSAEFAEPALNTFGLEFSDYISLFAFDAVDMDADGDLDMIATIYDDGEGFFYLGYLENTGSATNPIFDGNNPVEIGLELPADTYYSYSSTVDFDKDGDFDMLFTGAYYNNDNETYVNKVYYAENIGTPDNPQFTSAPIENVFGLGMDGLLSELILPFTVDIDGDGDEDVFQWGYEYADDGEYKFVFQENTSPIISSTTKVDLKVSITPNPTNDLVFFEHTDANVKSVQITDLAGKIIGQQKAVNQSISVRDLPAGMYILHCRLEDGQSAVARVVRE